MLGGKRKRSPKEVIAQTMEAMGKMLLQIKVTLLYYVPQCLDGLTSYLFNHGFTVQCVDESIIKASPGEKTDVFSGQILQLLRDNKRTPEDAEPRESFVLKRNRCLGEMVREHLNHLSETDPAKCDRHYQAIMGFVSQLDSSSEATNMLSSSRDVLFHHT